MVFAMHEGVMIPAMASSFTVFFISSSFLLILFFSLLALQHLYIRSKCRISVVRVLRLANVSEDIRMF